MRLFEITPNNNTLLSLTGKENLNAIFQIYMRMSTVYDKLVQGNNLSNSTAIWDQQLVEFNSVLKDAKDYLNNFPDQQDPIIYNTQARFNAYDKNIQKMTNELKQQGKI